MIFYFFIAFEANYFTFNSTFILLHSLNYLLIIIIIIIECKKLLFIDNQKSLLTLLFGLSYYTNIEQMADVIFV